MPKLVGKTLKLCLAVIVNILLLEKITLAVEETPVTINQTSNSLSQISQYQNTKFIQTDTVSPSAEELQNTNAMLQVTSVSQLSDVQPTGWAFQALQSLFERYGCIAGYPDSTYRGNRALTRYEFAAGVDACLDRVNELIATETADLVTRDDLATIKPPWGIAPSSSLRKCCNTYIVKRDHLLITRAILLR